jgi:hypothetical protein
MLHTTCTHTNTLSRCHAEGRTVTHTCSGLGCISTAIGTAGASGDEAAGKHDSATGGGTGTFGILVTAAAEAGRIGGVGVATTNGSAFRTAGAAAAAGSCAAEGFALEATDPRTCETTSSSRS